MPRALVTGGAGFIGSHVAERLLAEGYRVAVIDDLSAGTVENVPAEAELHQLDISSGGAAGVVRGGRFDLIVHAAAQMDVRHSVASPARGADVNVAGTVRLLEAVRASGEATRVIFASTGGALYGDLASSPSSENSVKEPDSPYGVSKLAAEYYLAFYRRAYGLESVSLRIGNVYGPRQDLNGEAGVVAIFCNRILERKPLTIFGDGMQTRDYVHVSDVVEAIWLASSAPLPAKETMDDHALNIGTGAGTTVLEVAGHLQHAAGTGLPLDFKPPRLGEERHAVLSVDKARRELGWAARTELAAGLANTYDWFADHFGPVQADKR